jgi:predicted DNA-binding transcriptional regulator AlpA
VSLSQTSTQVSTSGLALGAFERAGTVLSEYMTPEELASELGICKRTLDRWHAARTGPPRVTVGRRPVYRREAVAQWLRKREQDFEQPKTARLRRRADGR